MFRPLTAFVLLAAVLTAQDPPPSTSLVEVPIAPNQTCPIMGKKVSLPLFVDTELGRIWVCCKPCYRKILANVPKAHQTAYPVVAPVAVTTCPVSGEPIGEHAVEITLQGSRFSLCCAGCVDEARARSQVVLAKVLQPRLVDVGNATCPLRGTPVAANAFVVIDGHIVHLADPKLVEAVRKEPTAVLAKARELAQAQPPRQKHEHRPARAADATGAEAR